MLRIPGRIAAPVMLLLAVSAAAACNSDSTSNNNTGTITGTYTLKTVDGVALPAPGKDVNGNLIKTITAGTLTINTDGSYSTTQNFTLLAGGTAGNNSTSGTYTASGTSVALAQTGGSTVTGLYSGGNTIAVTLNGQAYVFMK